MYVFKYLKNLERLTIMKERINSPLKKDDEGGISSPVCLQGN